MMPGFGALENLSVGDLGTSESGSSGSATSGNMSMGGVHFAAKPQQMQLITVAAIGLAAYALWKK